MDAKRLGEGESIRYSVTLSEKTINYAILLDDGSVLRVSTAFDSAFVMALEFISPMLLLFLFVLVAAFLVAKKISSSIVRPINEIDTEHPERASVYPELRPITKKLSEQNYRIAKQIDELKIRENEFASITSNMSEGMIIINSKTEILSSNDSARELFMLGENGKSILSANISEQLREAILSALSGKGSGYDFTKGERHYSVIATPVFSDGIVEGAVVVIIDDSEKEQRESLRREFTSNVSHELKTPLTSISGFAELIKDGVAEGEEAKRFAGNIHKEAKRLIDLVKDIIRLTQLDGAEMPYDTEKIDLLSLSRDVAERLSSIAEREEVRVSVSGQPLLVSGNSRIIEEIIYNLTDNAIKYNKKGGSVDIKVYKDQDLSTLSVKDNGIGIPPDKKDRVFERFYRVDKSHSKAIGGTGLGLSIVKHAAAYHKAKLEIESAEGVGTEILVRFPGNDV